MEIIRSVVAWMIGLCFMVILFPLSFIIWIIVLPFDRNRVIIHWILMYQSLFLTFLMPIWQVSVEGRNKAVKGTTYIILSNHQSILDILLLNSLLFRYKWISKIENTKVPFLGWYLRMADYITVNRGNEESKTEMLGKSINCLKRGLSIMIFPEGTRSHDKEVGFFKRGAFQLAIQANVPILPIVIDGTGDILPKNGLVFGSGYHIRIKVLDPVNPSSFATSSPEDLAEKFRILIAGQLDELRNKNINNVT